MAVNPSINMAMLEGRWLFTAVTSLTCLGFLLIGYDNGLMGGYAAISPHPSKPLVCSPH